MVRFAAIMSLIGLSVALASCTPPFSKNVRLGRHNFQIPPGVGVSLYPDPYDGADWIALRVMDFRDPESSSGRACNPLKDGPGYRIFVKVIPPSQSPRIGELVADVVANNDPIPAVLPSQEELGVVESLALSRLQTEAPNGLIGFGGQAPFARCGRGCRVLFRIDDLLIDAGCGGYAQLKTTPSDLRAFVLATDFAIRSWLKR